MKSSPSLHLLPPDHIDLIADLCGAATNRNLAVSCRAFYRRLRLRVLIGRLFSGRRSDAKAIRRLVDDIAVLARAHPDVVRSYANTVTYPAVIAVLDQIIESADYPEIAHQLVHVLRQPRFAELAPGILLHARVVNKPVSSSIYERNLQTVLSHAREFVRLPVACQFGNVIQDAFSVFFANQRLWYAGMRHSPPEKAMFQELFGEFYFERLMERIYRDAFLYELSSVASARRISLTSTTEEPSYGAADNSNCLQIGPSTLLALLRIGIRFSPTVFLRQVSTSESDLDAIVPFLCPLEEFATPGVFLCGPESPQIRPLLRYPIYRDKFAICIRKFSDYQQLQVLTDVISNKLFEMYRFIRQFVDLNEALKKNGWKRPRGRSLLLAAVIYDAPVDILDDILSCPHLDLQLTKREVRHVRDGIESDTNAYRYLMERNASADVNNPAASMQKLSNSSRGNIRGQLKKGHFERNSKLRKQRPPKQA